MLRLHSKIEEKNKRNFVGKQPDKRIIRGRVDKTSSQKINCRSNRKLGISASQRVLCTQTDLDGGSCSTANAESNIDCCILSELTCSEGSSEEFKNKDNDQDKLNVINCSSNTRGVCTRSSSRTSWLRRSFRGINNNPRDVTIRAKKALMVCQQSRDKRSLKNLHHRSIVKKSLSSASGSSLLDSSKCQLSMKRLCDKVHGCPPLAVSAWLKTFQSWSPMERLSALDHLIDACELSEVRHVLSVIEPQFQRDFISLLPKELALYVLSFLEPKDLCRAAQTCRCWRILTEDNLLWREKCQQEMIDDMLVYGSRRRRGMKSPWKALFVRQKRIELNWRCNVLRPPKVLKGHDDHVITCLEFSGHRIVSGSDDNTLKVWSAITGKCQRTLTGHTGGVWSSQMVDKTIVSGSTDRTIRVWDADSGHCLHVLYGHSSTVRCLHLKNGVLVSGSRDATLRVWDVDSGECKHVLVGHVAAVRCVQYDGKRVVSGAYDYTVKVWDPDSETCLHTLSGHTDRVYSLQFDGVHIVSGSLDTSIRVWNVESGACVSTLVGHQSLTSGMELRENILVSGNADSTVKVWNIMTGQCLHTLHGLNKHQSAVTSLQFSGKFIITSSDDGTVKLWDLKTGEFLRNLVSLDSRGSGGVVWRIRSTNTKLVCAVGSRNGTEDTKLLVMDFDVDDSLPSNTPVIVTEDEPIGIE